MSGPLRFGVAGLGAVAQVVHLPLLARRSDLFTVAALCDLSPGRRREVGDRLGVPESRRFPTVSQMLDAGDLDAVALLTGGSHAPDALTVLRHGLPVFVEKPLSYTRAEAAAVAAAETDAGHGRPMVQVGYMKQYDVAARRMQRLLPDPAEIRSVTVEVLHPADAAQLAFAHLTPAPGDIDPAALARLDADDAALLEQALGRADDAARRLYRNVLLGSVIHDVSLLRVLTGLPERIDRVRVWPDDAWPPSLEISGVLPGGAGLHVGWHFLPDYPAYHETITVHHLHGTLALEFPAPYLLNAPSELRVRERDGEAEQDRSYRSTVEEFEQELIGFHALVTAGTPPVSGPAEAGADIGASQQILAAWCAQTGRRLGGEAGQA